MHRVYALVSSRDESVVRYIGLTARTLNKRMSYHRWNADHGLTNHVYNWMRKEAAEGYDVTIVELASGLSRSEAGELERRLISEYRAAGVRLCNMTAGGEGVAEPDEEVRRRISDANRRNWADPLFRAKMMQAMAHPDRVERIAASGRKRYEDPAERRRTGEAVAAGLTADGKRRIAEATLARHGYSGPPEPRPCPVCSTVFTPARRSRTTCSDECWKEAAAIKRRATWAAKRGSDSGS